MTVPGGWAFLMSEVSLYTHRLLFWGEDDWTKHISFMCRAHTPVPEGPLLGEVPLFCRDHARSIPLGPFMLQTFRGRVLTVRSNFPGQWLQCEANGSNGCRVRSSDLELELGLQGDIAHKKTPIPLGPP